jgi:glycerate kinase
VCIGGSATVDGGVGLAQAAGARFFDSQGKLITDPLTGGDLQRIARSEPAQDLPRIRVACDVDNPLCGRQGAAAGYGPQKGATPQQVRALDQGLAQLAQRAGVSGDQPGFGAAGGAGFGLAVFGGATLERGIELMLDVTRFAVRCRDAALVLTGEGRLDGQTLRGKAVMGVARAAARCGLPTVAIVGSTGPGWERCLDRAPDGFLRGVVSLSDRFGPDRARRETIDLLSMAACNVVRDAISGPTARPRRRG